MEERNKVSVKIFGQEFIVSGHLPRDQIIKIADYVDGKMNKLADTLPSCSVSSLAVLAAVNCAEEYFKEVGINEETKLKNQQLEKDTEHYIQLWEEAKKSFLQYKEDAQSAIEQKEKLQRLFNEKSVEYNELLTNYQELKRQYDSLQSKNDNLVLRVETQKNEKESSVSMVKELEEKCRELESSFFDIQMENIQLKGDLDRFKKIIEQHEQ